MRERTRLDTAISECRTYDQELKDQIELAEMAEMEDDAAVIDDAIAVLSELADKTRPCVSNPCCPARPTAMIVISKSTPGPAAPKARTGPRC